MDERSAPPRLSGAQDMKLGHSLFILLDDHIHVGPATQDIEHHDADITNYNAKCSRARLTL